MSSAITSALLVLYLHAVVSYNIVFYHGVATSSHRTAIWPFAERLADLGHNVTYIFPIEPLKRVGHHPRVEEILPSKMLNLTKSYVSDFDLNIALQDRVNEWLQTAFSFGVTLCDAFYESPEIQEWLYRPNLHYDIAFIDASFGECFYGVVHKLKIPKHVVFIPFLCGLVYDSSGVVPESSSFPDPFTPYKQSMTLIDRTWNTIISLLWRYNMFNYITNLEPVVKQKINDSRMPPIVEFEQNTSLVLHNSHFIEEYAASLPPSFVSYSGLNCNKTKVKPLPAGLSNFIAKHDRFVYVSLGSAVEVGKMPEELRDSFFTAFKAFPQVAFVWRWSGGEVPKNKPQNVWMDNWFPQVDVVGHKKIKGFVTQGGRASVQEAICFGVPLVAIPVFADQFHNANKMEEMGSGLQLDLKSLNAEDLKEAIHEVLHNAKYKSSMDKLSRLFMDRPISAMDNLLYWMEYILRYEDTSFLKPLGIRQSWYQRRLLDVYGFLLVMVVTLVIVLAGFIVVLYKISLCMTRSISKSKTKLE